MKPVIRAEHPFMSGINFRRLSVAQGKGLYRFILTEDVTFIYSCNIVEREVSFRDSNDVEWMRMTPRTKTIRRGYAWNGNSPKKGYRILGRELWVGTPDYDPGTLEASCNHDTDFQFAHTEHFPFSWTEVNHHYFVLARAAGFKLAGAFHGALKDFSMPAWKSASSNSVHSFLL